MEIIIDEGYNEFYNSSLSLSSALRKDEPNITSSKTRVEREGFSTHMSGKSLFYEGLKDSHDMNMDNNIGRANIRHSHNTNSYEDINDAYLNDSKRLLRNPFKPTSKKHLSNERFVNMLEQHEPRRILNVPHHLTFVNDTSNFESNRLPNGEITSWNHNTSPVNIFTKHALLHKSVHEKNKYKNIRFIRDLKNSGSSQTRKSYTRKIKIGLNNNAEKTYIEINRQLKYEEGLDKLVEEEERWQGSFIVDRQDGVLLGGSSAFDGVSNFDVTEDLQNGEV